MKEAGRPARRLRSQDWFANPDHIDMTALYLERFREVIREFARPLKELAGFLVLSGNLFDFAIMKTSVISTEFSERYLSRPGAEGRFECRAIVFENSDDYHARINDPALAIDENCILVIRGVCPAFKLVTTIDVVGPIALFDELHV